jgi:hypothetical protein
VLANFSLLIHSLRHYERVKMKATVVLALMAVMVAVVYAKENGATTAIMAGAGSGMSMSLNPLTTFQGGCQACVGAYPGT